MTQLLMCLDVCGHHMCLQIVPTITALLLVCSTMYIGLAHNSVLQQRSQVHRNLP
jgi:hypothetical protein